VSIRNTTTWPPVTWNDSGTIRTTYPPTATRTSGGQDPTGGGGSGGGGNPPSLFPLFCPPAPPRIRLPPLTISRGAPKPVTTLCAYPASPCPAPGTTPPRPGGLVVPPGLPPQDTTEVDLREVCLLDPSVPTTTRIKTQTAIATAISTLTAWT
jgi:chitinase